jgi:hypothetical protein
MFKKQELNAPLPGTATGLRVDHRRKFSVLPFSFFLGKTKPNLTKLNIIA